MKPTTRRRVGFVVGFTVYFGVLWVFWWSPVIYPLKVFVVFLHEISHGIASIATGGSIQRITLDPRLGGACDCPGGNAFLTLSAGYLGSLAWGGVLLELGRWAGTRAGWLVRSLGVLVAILTLLYVRGGFGIAFGLLFGLGLVVRSHSDSHAREPDAAHRARAHELPLRSPRHQGRYPRPTRVAVGCLHAC